MKATEPLVFLPAGTAAVYSTEPYVRPVSTEDPAVLLERHRDAVLQIQRFHGVERAWIFGSVAWRVSHPGSDLDLLIEAGPVVPPFFPGGLVVDLETVLGCAVHVVDASALDPLVRDQVLEDPVILFGTGT